jgi:hypothetical protein
MEFLVGDNIVNPETLRMGVVTEINSDDNQMLVQYAGGISEWVDVDKIKQLLIDENDNNSKTFLTE